MKPVKRVCQLQTSNQAGGEPVYGRLTLIGSLIPRSTVQILRRPSPPLPYSTHPNPIFTTSQDRKEQWNLVEQLVSIKPVPRATRTVLKKVVKAVDKFAYQKTKTALQLAGQKRQIEAVDIRGRKKAAIDTQATFADTAAIKASKDKAEEAI